jgi:bifunctional enzyme CysN/CysC
LVLENDVDASRGDVIATTARPVEAADQFEADLLWMSEHPLLPGRSYAALLHTRAASVTITSIKHRLDINDGTHRAAKSLALNEIGTVNVSFDRSVPFAPYKENKRLGAFIVIDKLTNETIGAAIIHFALRRAVNVHWQALAVTKAVRAEMKHQKARCLWFTGLSGSGKSTIANLLEQRLYADGRHTYILDGDNVRHGLNRDLGFTEADRVEHSPRPRSQPQDAGRLCSSLLFHPSDGRQLARGVETASLSAFVDTPLEERDATLKVLAQRGAGNRTTGIDSDYEPPEAPEIHLRTLRQTGSLRRSDCPFAEILVEPELAARGQELDCLTVWHSCLSLRVRRMRRNLFLLFFVIVVTATFSSVPVANAAQPKNRLAFSALAYANPPSGSLMN